jgi:Zn-dependent protease
MYQQPADLLSIVVPVAIVLLSLTVHEAAHAWTSDRLGDPTARTLGRVSLNPLVHIDLIGTVLLPLIAAASNLPIIGWAKPVPVDIRRLRHPRRDFALVAAAGPASNLAQAAVMAVLFHVLPLDGVALFGLNWPNVVRKAADINVLLALFNMVPVPPLDGGNVLAGLLPPDAAATFNRLRPFGIFILYALLLTGVLGALIVPPADFLMEMLGL